MCCRFQPCLGTWQLGHIRLDKADIGSITFKLIEVLWVESHLPKEKDIRDKLLAGNVNFEESLRNLEARSLVKDISW